MNARMHEPGCMGGSFGQHDQACEDLAWLHKPFSHAKSASKRGWAEIFKVENKCEIFKVENKDEIFKVQRREWISNYSLVH